MITLNKEPILILLGRIVLLFALFTTSAWGMTNKPFHCSNSGICLKNIPDTLRLHLKLIYDQSRSATGIQISYLIPAKSGTKRDFSLFLDNMYPLTRNRDTVANLVVKDDIGIVPFLGKANQVENTRYQATRQVEGTVMVDYFIQAADSNRSGPHWDMQQTGGGLSGSYVSILLLPDFPVPFTTELIWELRPDDAAVSTFGKGNAISRTKLEIGDLLYAQFVVGKLFNNPIDAPDYGFSVSGLGLTKQQIGHSLPIFSKIYEYMRQQLNGPTDEAFRFFFRSFDGGPLMSGTATQTEFSGSFVVYMPPNSSLEGSEVLNLVAHEMIHVFVDQAETDLYSEGIADYLSALLPYQAGVTSKENFLKLINEAAAQYYTNSLRLASDSAYNELKWSTTNAWALAYSRGMLYFANLDAKLNRLPSKHPTVLSLVLDMKKMAQTGKPSWETVLRTQVGEWAVDDYKMVRSGKLLIPEPGAFGDNFVIKKRRAGVFDLGYQKSMGVLKGQVVKGLNPMSKAAKAGLKDGDIFTETLELTQFYGSYDNQITVTVNRNGALLSFSFHPRGELTDAWQWAIRKQPGETNN